MIFIGSIFPLFYAENRPAQDFHFNTHQTSAIVAILGAACGCLLLTRLLILQADIEKFTFNFYINYILH